MAKTSYIKAFKRVYEQVLKEHDYSIERSVVYVKSNYVRAYYHDIIFFNAYTELSESERNKIIIDIVLKNNAC